MGSTLFGTTTGEEVTCIACGETVDEDDAFEYDKHGDQWSREGKEFEYICKPCYRDYCHQNRDGLEETLVAAGAGQTDRETFLRQFCELLADEDGLNETRS
jgi:hypothetical protein